MKCLLDNKKLVFTFRSDEVLCSNYDNYYQADGMLSFAILDLAYKIIKQHKRDYIVLRKKRPIIHLLNYVDALNFNSKKIRFTYFLENKYKTRLVHSLYYYRSKHFDREDSLDIFENKNSYIIMFDGYDSVIQPHYANLVAMVMHILEESKHFALKEFRYFKIPNLNGIIFYCTFLM